MTATNTKKRPLFSSLRLVVSLGMVLGVAGATALHTDDVSAKPPKGEKNEKTGYWECTFDNANGGSITTSETTAPISGAEPDCSAVCKGYANGTNCDEASATWISGPKKAPSKKEKHKQH